MLNYIIRRLVTAFFLMIGISLVSFIVIKLPPGDFATSYQQYLMARGTPSDDAKRAADTVRKQYGLDQPMLTQYYTWMRDMVTKGEFGYSLAYRKDVGELIKERLPRTLLVAGLAHLISTFFGVGVGIYVATRKYGIADNFWAVLTFLFTSVPRFSLAIILLYVLVIRLDQPSISAFSPTLTQ